MLDGVPTVKDLGYPQIAKFTVNRVVGGPPGMPADVAAKLAEGFRAATESETVQSWAAGTSTELNFMDAASTKAMMDDLSNFYLQYKDLLKK